MLSRKGIKSKQTLYNIRVLSREFTGKQARGVFQLIKIVRLPDVRTSALPVNGSYTTFRSIRKIIDILSKRRIPYQGLNKDFIRAQCIFECFHNIDFPVNQIMAETIGNTDPLKTLIKTIPGVFPPKFYQFLNS